MKYKDENHDKYDRKLGKITDVKFGNGGYQDAQFGLTLTLESKSGTGCGVFVCGGWNYSHIKHDSYCKWTEEDRTNGMAEMCREICRILHDAKVDTVDKLLGKPVEFATESFTLKSWRILEEVL